MLGVHDQFRAILFEHDFAAVDLIRVVHRVGETRTAGLANPDTQADTDAALVDLLLDAPGGAFGQLDTHDLLLTGPLIVCVRARRTSSPMRAQWALSSLISRTVRIVAASLAAHVDGDCCSSRSAEHTSEHQSL